MYCDKFATTEEATPSSRRVLAAITRMIACARAFDPNMSPVAMHFCSWTATLRSKTWSSASFATSSTHEMMFSTDLSCSKSSTAFWHAAWFLTPSGESSSSTKRLCASWGKFHFSMQSSKGLVVSMKDFEATSRESHVTTSFPKLVASTSLCLATQSAMSGKTSWRTFTSMDVSCWVWWMASRKVALLSHQASILAGRNKLASSSSPFACLAFRIDAADKAASDACPNFARVDAGKLSKSSAQPFFNKEQHQEKTRLVVAMAASHTCSPKARSIEVSTSCIPGTSCHRWIMVKFLEQRRSRKATAACTKVSMLRFASATTECWRQFSISIKEPHSSVLGGSKWIVW